MVSPLRNAFLVSGCIVILAAAGLRLFDLGGKVIHADESVQAWKTGELLQGGGYRYDPEDHHGPTLYYLAGAVSWLMNERSVGELEITHLRLVPATAGIILVALTITLGGAIGWRAALLAGAFTATSPLLVYYSRHFIQESLLVLFSLGAIIAGWRWHETRRLPWAARTGVFLGLMIATKETWVLNAIALGIGWIAVRPQIIKPPILDTCPRLALQFVVAALATVGVATILYTSFLTRPDALLDVGRGLINGIYRAGDSVHAKPWHTYLSLLTWSTRSPFHWSEAALLFLAFAAIPTFRNRQVAHFLAVYAGTLLLAYSIIPYKTPWLACSFWHPIAILAGCGAARLLGPQQPHATRAAAAFLIVLVLAQLGWQAHRAAGPLAGSPRNPYGYVETSRDLLRMPVRLKAVAAVHSDRTALEISVAVAQPWPLPWYLREYPNARYEAENRPDNVADVLLISPEFFAALPEATQQNFGTEFFGLRDGEIIILAVERSLWERSLELSRDQL